MGDAVTRANLVAVNGCQLGIRGSLAERLQLSHQLHDLTGKWVNFGMNVIGHRSTRVDFFAIQQIGKLRGRRGGRR
jgi:hypothetical protein